jgi:hypothetical protein
MENWKRNASAQESHHLSRVALPRRDNSRSVHTDGAFQYIWLALALVALLIWLGVDYIKGFQW